MKTDKVVPLEKDQLLKQNEDLAREGYRVIAVADGKVDNWVEKMIMMKKTFQILLI